MKHAAVVSASDARSRRMRVWGEGNGCGATNRCRRTQEKSLAERGISHAMNLGMYDFFPLLAGKGPSVQFLQVFVCPCVRVCVCVCVCVGGMNCST